MAESLMALSWLLGIILLPFLLFRRYSTARVLGATCLGLNAAGASIAGIAADEWADAAATLGLMTFMFCIGAALVWLILRLQRNAYARWAGIAALVSIPAFIACMATAPAVSTKKPTTSAVETTRKERNVGQETPRQSSPQASHRDYESGTQPHENVSSHQRPKAKTPKPRAPSQVTNVQKPAAATQEPYRQTTTVRSQRPPVQHQYHPSAQTPAPLPVQQQQPAARAYPPAVQTSPSSSPDNRGASQGSRCPQGGYHVRGKIDRNGRTHCARCGRLM